MHVLYCPYCNRVLESTNHPVSYGNPLKQCPHCTKTYIDPYCSEPALREYKPLSIKHQFWTNISSGITLAGLIAIIVFLISKNNRLGCLIWGIGTPIFWLLSFSYSLLTQKKREPRRLKTWQESDQRLRNSEYAAILANYGYSVPAQYLPPDFKVNRNAFPYHGATVAMSTSDKKHNPPPHMPNGSEFY